MAKKRERIDRTYWGWAEDHVPGNITDKDMKTAYRLNGKQHKPNTCRKNCRLNPNCLSGFGEQSLNQTIDKDAELENFMSNKLRVPGSYVGLKNLGNTCYINSLLQLWFHNIPFREAVYGWNALEDRQEIAKHLEVHNRTLELHNYEPLSSIAHLQYLFCEMQFGLNKYCDPEAFCRSLSIDVELQQDAQEFNKLYMQRLEESFQTSSNPKTRRIIQDQFRGEYSYVTTCCNCLNESERPSYFYELELKVKNCKTILDSLEEFLSKEPLTGDNKYFCSNCNDKHDAYTRIRLQELPPVLQLQLLRYEIDSTLGTRRKIHSAIQFPDILDMSSYLFEPPRTFNYKLIAVLMHGGTTAYSGHYYAHINTADGWHVFDDINVKKEKHLNLANEENLIPIADRKSCGPKLKGFRSSSSVYMLVYRKIDKTESSEVSSSNDVKKGSSVSFNDDVSSSLGNLRSGKEVRFGSDHANRMNQNCQDKSNQRKKISKSTRSSKAAVRRKDASEEDVSCPEGESPGAFASRNETQDTVVDSQMVEDEPESNALNFATASESETLSSNHRSNHYQPVEFNEAVSQNNAVTVNENSKSIQCDLLNDYRDKSELIMDWLAEQKKANLLIENNSINFDQGKFMRTKIADVGVMDESGEVYLIFEKKLLNHPRLRILDKDSVNGLLDDPTLLNGEMGESCNATRMTRSSVRLKVRNESVKVENESTSRLNSNGSKCNVVKNADFPDSRNGKAPSECREEEIGHKREEESNQDGTSGSGGGSNGDGNGEGFGRQCNSHTTVERMEFKSKIDEAHWKMLPDYLRNAILKSRHQVRSSFNSQLVEINSRIDTQNVVKTISETIMPDPELKDYEFINFEWLKSVAKNLASPIDNSELICKHGKLNVNKRCFYKAISSKAADFLYEKFEGGPRLKSDDLCRLCVENKAKQVKIQMEVGKDSKLLMSLIKQVIEPDQKAYWVGKRTLRRWTNYVLDELDVDGLEDDEDLESGNVAKDGSGAEDGRRDASDAESAVERSKSEFEEELNESFNDDIVCVHGNLTAEESDRRLVSELAWNILQKYFPNAEAFERDHSPCVPCQNLASQDKEHRDAVRKNAVKEKELLKDLFEKKQSFDLFENETSNYLVDSSFMMKWRKYIRSIQRQTMLDAPRPEDLMSNLLCPQHSLLLYDPETDVDRFSSLTVKEWEVLRSYYPTDAELKVIKLENGSFTTSIDVCKECVHQRRQAEAEEDLQNRYVNASIYVWKVDNNVEDCDSDDTEESPSKKRKLNSSKPEDVPGNQGVKKPEQVRRSARARQPKKGRKMFIVNRFTTLKDLKFMIFNKFTVMPTDQHLSLNGIDLDTLKETLQLTDAEATLMRLEVKPNDVLQLVADEPTPGVNLCDSENFLLPEAGFKGTELGGK